MAVLVPSLSFGLSRNSPSTPLNHGHFNTFSIMRSQKRRNPRGHHTPANRKTGTFHILASLDTAACGGLLRHGRRVSRDNRTLRNGPGRPLARIWKRPDPAPFNQEEKKACLIFLPEICIIMTDRKIKRDKRDKKL